MFLEECIYVVKKKKIPKYIIDNIEISSDSDRENSCEEAHERYQNLSEEEQYNKQQYAREQ